MRYTKFLLIFMMTALLCAENQVEITGGAALYEPEQNSPMGRFDWHGFTSKFPHLKLIGNAGFEGVDAVTSATMDAYFRGKTTPFAGFADGTAELKGRYSRLRVLEETNFSPKSRKIMFPITSEGNSPYISDMLAHRVSFGSGIGCRFDHTFVEGDADLLLRSGSFDRFSDTIASNYRENDLWYGVSLASKLFDEQLSVGGTVQGKNDLNSYDGYNWQRSSLGTQTHFVFNKRKTQIHSSLALTDLQGEMVKEKGYAVGIGADARVRMVQKIKGGFYLKGDAECAGRNETLRGRVGGSVRKAGRIGAVETGYWTTKGVLYPRQCEWASGTVSLVQSHVDLESSLKNYWIGQNGEYRYYRTELGALVTVRPFSDGENPSRKLALKAGGVWKRRVYVENYSSGAELYAGIESIIR